MAKLEVVIDARKAKAGAKEFIDAQEDMRRATRQAADDAVRAADKEVKAQKQRAEAAEDAARRTIQAQQDSFAKLERFTTEARGWIGDVSDAVGMLGKDFLGLSAQQQKTLEGTLDMTEKGAALGEVFGPLGAIIGASIGGLAGYFAAASTQAAETEAKVKDVRKELDEAKRAFGDLNSIDLSGAVSQIVKLQAKIDAIKGFNPAVQAQLDELAKGAVTEQVKAYEQLAQLATGRAKHEGKNLEDLLDLYDAKNKSLEELQRQASAAATVTKSYADAEGLSAKATEGNQNEIKGLTKSIGDALKEKAQLKALIDDYGKVSEVAGGAAKGAAEIIDTQAKAIRTAHQELKALNDEVVRFMGLNGSSASGTGSVLDDATWLAMQAGNANPDDLIGFMERDAIMQEERNGGADEDPFSMMELAEKQKTPMQAWIEQYDQLGDAQKQFEEILIGSFDSIASGLAQTLWGADVDWRETMRSMGIELTKLLIKMAVAAGLKAVIGGATGGVGAALGAGVLGDLIVGGSFHDGGTVGNGGGSPMVAPASLFKGAPRFHGGLAPDEFPAILQTGEQVLSRQQVAEGRGNGGGKIVNITNYFPDVKDSRGFGRSIDQNSSRLRRMIGGDS